MTHLLSLADELLYHTFEYATLDDLENNAFSALKISHISRRCRSQVFANPKLWTNIRHGPELRSMDFVAACLQRSGDLPLNIIATIVPSDHASLAVATNVFVTYIREHAAARCKSMQLRYLPRTWSYRKPLFESPDLWVGDGVFPELQVLKISFPLLPSDIYFATALWSRRFLEARSPFPKLQELSLRNFTPYILDGNNNLSRLDLTCTNQSSQHLQKFLVSCKVLHDLHLTLYMPSDDSVRFISAELSMPSLRNFHLLLFVDGYLKADNALKPIFSTIAFPNLPVFNIHIEFLDKVSWLRCWDEVIHFTARNAPERMDFGTYLAETICENKFPSLDSLQLSFSVKSQTGGSYEKAKFAIPVHFLPSLQNLGLQSNLLLEPDLVREGHVEHLGGFIGSAKVMVKLNAQMLCDKEWLEQINGRIVV